MSPFPALEGFAPLPEREYALQLFIAGASPPAEMALRTLQAICAQHVPGRHSLTML